MNKTNEELNHIGYEHGYDGEDYAYPEFPAYNEGYLRGAEDAALNYHLTYN